MDEFLIEAESPNVPMRVWTRRWYSVAQFIAEYAVCNLHYRTAKVYNIHGGNKSDALYVVEATHSLNKGTNHANQSTDQ